MNLFNEDHYHTQSYWNSRHYRFYRDSRQVFGVRFQVEKPSHDWLWAVAGLIVGIVAVLAFAAKMS